MSIRRYLFPDPGILGLLRAINCKLDRVLSNQEIIMATLEETLAAVTAEDTKIDSIVAYNTGLKKQLDDALAGATLPAPVQAKIDDIFARANASAAKIDTALNANTPPPAVT